MANNISVANGRLVIDDGTNLLSLDRLTGISNDGSTIRLLGSKGNLKNMTYDNVGTIGGSVKPGNITATVAAIHALLNAQYSVSSAATTNAALVKAGQTNVTGILITNVSGGTKYVKLYNKATAPTVGTDVPLLIIPIAAGATVNLPYGPAIKFALGLGVGITGAAADNDTTAVAAGDIRLIINYI